jgi:drug/metabolite transporter (DMT)-like permease
MVSTPMIVLTLSAIIMKERAKTKSFGIVLGLVGTAFLIYTANLLAMLPCRIGEFSVLVTPFPMDFTDYRQEINKYNAFTFVKWIYLFGF